MEEDNVPVLPFRPPRMAVLLKSREVGGGGLLENSHRFDVMRKHVEPTADHPFDVLPRPLEVGDERLDQQPPSCLLLEQ